MTSCTDQDKGHFSGIVHQIIEFPFCNSSPMEFLNNEYITTDKYEIADTLNSGAIFL